MSENKLYVAALLFCLYSYAKFIGVLSNTSTKHMQRGLPSLSGCRVLWHSTN